MNHPIMFLERHNKTKLVPACSCKKEVQISRKNTNKENLKVIKNILPNISGNPENLKN